MAEVIHPRWRTVDKVIIQIPCYNEEQTLGMTLDALPRSLPHVKKVEILVIDDGSTDKTVEVARAHGADHILIHHVNRGLARAFMTGIEFCIRAKADIIVNTDADNQYCAEDIPRLIEPILKREAEIVVGARPIRSIPHFSPIKKFLQRLGSWVVRLASGTAIPDAPSGFRAFTREAAMRLNVFDSYTYTLETIIQAGRKNMRITSVPVRVNPETRPSRLVRSIPQYLYRSIITIIRIFVTYRPFRFFFTLGILAGLIGLIPSIRFLYFYWIGEGGGHIQSLLFSALMLGISFGLVVLGLVADLIAVNRMLLEDLRWKLREIEMTLQRVEKSGRS